MCFTWPRLHGHPFWAPSHHPEHVPTPACCPAGHASLDSGLHARVPRNFPQRYMHLLQPLRSTHGSPAAFRLCGCSVPRTPSSCSASATWTLAPDYWIGSCWRQAPVALTMLLTAPCIGLDVTGRPGTSWGLTGLGLSPSPSVLQFPKLCPPPLLWSSVTDFPLLILSSGLDSP
jgi:hypothetical protein